MSGWLRATMRRWELADDGLVDGYGPPGQVTLPEQGFVMVDRLEMVAERLAADRDAVLDEFGGFPQRQRVAFDRVR